jgi:hypothetical protein
MFDRIRGLCSGLSYIDIPQIRVGHDLCSEVLSCMSAGLFIHLQCSRRPDAMTNSFYKAVVHAVGSLALRCDPIQ